MEVFYQVLITVIVYDILERRETRRSREGKNSMEKTNSFICCLIDWWLLISRVTRFFIEIYYCYPMNTSVYSRLQKRSDYLTIFELSVALNADRPYTL